MSKEKGVELVLLSSLDFFVWGILKEKVSLINITNLMLLTQRIRDECAKIEGNKILLHRVYEDFVKRINILRKCIASLLYCINICLVNYGNPIEDVSQIKIQIMNEVFRVLTYFYLSVQTLWTPCRRPFFGNRYAVGGGARLRSTGKR